MMVSTAARRVMLTILAATALSATAARAQDGAPQPLAAEGTYEQSYEPAYEPTEGYVPMPAGMEEPDMADLLVDPPAPMAEPVPEVIAEDVPMAPPVPPDPMTACREQVGVDYTGEAPQAALNDCLEERHAASEITIETAARNAHARMVPEGRAAIRSLASSNLSYVAFRDAECMRQKAAAPDANNAQQIDWACRTIMNDMRSRMLGVQ